MASTWTVACAQPTDARGDEQTPAPRYGHGAAIRDEIMTITHGYYFDHERCKPMFLDDTWEYHTKHKKWRYRSLGSVRPCKRFHVQYAWDSTHLYLFGGTDGGLRVNKGENFIFGPRAEFNDLWRLQLNEDSARGPKIKFSPLFTLKPPSVPPNRYKCEASHAYCTWNRLHGRTEPRLR